MTDRQSRGLLRRLRNGLGDDDFLFGPTIDGEPLNRMPRLPIVRAGDGGTWYPVWVYVPKSRSKKKR